MVSPGEMPFPIIKATNRRTPPCSLTRAMLAHRHHPLIPSSEEEGLKCCPKLPPFVILNSFQDLPRLRACLKGS